MKKAVALLIIVVVIMLPCASFAIAPYDDSAFPQGMTGVLIEAESGEILFEKNADVQIVPASTTKIMTALLVLENVEDITQTITLGSEVDQFSSTSSLMHLYSQRDISIEDLLYGLLLVSGNDAAAALAVHVGGSIEGFADMMNAKAKELGMENSHFTNPHGLNLLEQEHYSTAADMGKLAVAAYKNPEFMKICGTIEYTVESAELATESQLLINHNYLLRTPSNREEYSEFLYEYANGMKTGLLQNYEGNDYYGCLVASARNDDVKLVSAVFGDTSEKAQQRWRSVKSMFDYGFDNYTWINVSDYITPFADEQQVANFVEGDEGQGLVSVKGSPAENNPTKVLIDTPTAQGLADGSIQLEQEVEYDEQPLEAPIVNGGQVGTVTYLLNGHAVYTENILASRSVQRSENVATATPAPQETSAGQTSTAKDGGLSAVWENIKSFLDFGDMWWLWIVICGGAALVIVLIIVGRRRRNTSFSTPAHHREHRSGGFYSDRRNISDVVGERRPSRESKNYSFGSRQRFAGHPDEDGFEDVTSENELSGSNSFMSKRSKVRRSTFYFDRDGSDVDDINFDISEATMIPEVQDAIDSLDDAYEERVSGTGRRGFNEIEDLEEIELAFEDDEAEEVEIVKKAPAKKEKRSVLEETHEIQISRDMLDSPDILDFLERLDDDDFDF